MEPDRAAARAWPSPARSWYLVGILLVAYSLSFADRMLMSLLIGPIKDSLGIGDFQVSLLIGAAFAVFYVGMGLPCGYLADRMNRRNLIVWGILIWSVATAACGLAAGFAALFIARMMVGAAEATLSPSAYSMIADSFPPRKLGRAISVYVVGNPLGIGIALLTGGLVIAALSQVSHMALPLVGTLETWRIVFIGLGIPGVVLALIVRLTVREPVRRTAPDRVGKALGWKEAPRHIKAHGRTFLFQLGGTCMLSLAVYGVMTWGPAYFERVHAMEPGAIGVRFGLILGGGGIAGLLAGGFLGDWLLARGRSDAYPRVMAMAAVLATPPGIMLGLVGDAQLALALTAINVLCTALTTGIAAAAVQLITPAHLRGQMGAIYILTASVAGIGIGPSVVAFLTQYVFGDEMAVGRSLAALAAGALPLAAILLWLGLPHYRRSVAQLHR
ncbi:MFS transporter [Croceicoccus mobilis]|uniref:MFS transporter n=1 Tax=Croceicoccus mobilis TaxID=1703339 RepID=A0A916Z784_9SPHN|nr:MFS transporter [Croceicoccus mobilis]GGD80029.1 MFS transporter [Croceicoccus mobilis]